LRYGTKGANKTPPDCAVLPAFGTGRPVRPPPQGLPPALPMVFSVGGLIAR